VVRCSAYSTLALALALVFGLATSCNREKATPPTNGGASEVPASASTTAPPPEREPLSLEGSTVALLADESVLVVADEDHEVLYLVPPDVSNGAKVRSVPLPGPPAQVVALDGRVLVTLRTLPTPAAREARDKIRGPLPAPSGATSFSSPAASAGSARPSGSSSPPSPLARKRNTPAAPFDPDVVRKGQGGLLLVLAPDAKAGLVERGRVTLAPDAWGLAVSRDRKRALVTSAWSSEVTLVDLENLRAIASAKTAREPRGVVILPDGKSAYVSHLVGAALTRLELRNDVMTAAPFDFPPAPARTPLGTTLDASLGYGLVLSPDAESLYVPRHALGAEGVEAWWGAPTVDVLDLTTAKPLAPAHRAGSPRAALGASDFERPAWEASPGQAPKPDLWLVQPRAVRYRRSTDTLLVASEGSDALVELDALAADPAMVRLKQHRLAPSYDPFGGIPDRGGAPSGIALSRDERQAYVYCRSTFDLVRVDLESGAQAGIHFAEDGLPADAAYGRRLFTSARRGAVSGGIGCAACHPEGRDDGYVWRETSFAEDTSNEQSRFVARRENLKLKGFAQKVAVDRPALHPRQTPMLAGRMRAMGPFGWHGQNRDILERLLDGFRLHRETWGFAPADNTTGEHVAKIDYIADYLRSGLLPPPTLDRALDELELRGKAIFESDRAMCSRCHVPTSEFTDRQALPLPALPVRPGFDREANLAFKTPSLWFVGGTAPYFHDGSRATLEDLLEKNADRMGRTSALDDGERAALVAYLKVL